VPQFQTPIERRNYEDYIIKEYFKPYFLSGAKKYIERGDVFTIEDLELFVLNSYPENGFICSETSVMLKLGLNKEKCLEKINNADNKYAFSLLSSEEGFGANILNTELDNSNNLLRNSSSDNTISLMTGAGITGGTNVNRIRSFDEFIIRGFLTNRLSCKNIFTTLFSG
jgi:hypothetical protein